MSEHRATAQWRVAVVDRVIDALALVDDDGQRLQRAVEVDDGDRFAGHAVDPTGAGDLPRRVAGEQVLLGGKKLQAGVDPGIELADRVVPIDPRSGPRWLRSLDPHERVDGRRREATQVDDQPAVTVRQGARIARHEAGAADRRSAANGVEHVGGEHHVQHLLHHDAFDQLGGFQVAGTTERVEGAQVRRDRAVLQFDRRLQSSPQLIEVGDRGDVAVPPTRGDHWRSPRIAAAVRQARAARVRVGLDVPIVGMLPAPTMNRLR